MKELVFLTPTSTQPRYRKRIDSYKSKNINVKVFSFKRKHQLINDFGITHNVHYLGFLEDGKYFKRFFILVKTFFGLKKTLKSNNNLYVFGLDLAFFSLFFLKNKKVILEIGDLRVSSNFLLNFLVNSFEKYVFNRIEKLVVTSSGFKNYYLERYPRITIEVKENKIKKEDLKKYDYKSKIQLKAKNKNKITIGVIGLLRYDSVIHLLNSYKDSLQFDIVLIGDGRLVKRIKEIENESNNIYYYGAFKNPDDLNVIYSLIDFNYVVYDSKDINVQLALPNKLYESIYFNVPIIVSKNTFLWKQVKSLGIGLCVDDSQNEIEFNFEEKLKLENLEKYKENISKIEENYLIDKE
ncbi:hypothetical protein LPB136_06560 [Tenacibaculum todarodis]|uniref:Glycosyl transferase family 1 domain-containing protein n=1 Tax=Tenacibaculum todarodis TaxID=1850252 RepID=A0A1L3JIV4_9FLAO|nr:hypothetical protein [Tenacibaculum todarodis]APG65039.1 hypothetical protein LPB136_06560 [Tenacibaculum todarodis]